MIYSILPEKNLSVSDIRDTLNGNGGDTGNDVASLFKTSANINKWAKYKPESFKKDFNLSDTERSSNNYGFAERSIGFGATVSELFDKSTSKELWQYVLPEGGEDSPYRLGDFRKYNPSATVPYNYKHVAENGTTVNNNYSQEQRVVINDDSELRIEDFEVFERLSQGGGNLYYFWIARISTGSGTYDYIISNYTPVSGSYNNIYCTLNFNKTGTWECLFCVGRDDYNNDSEYISARTDCLALPQGYKTFTLIKKVLFVRVTMAYPNQSGYGSWISYSDHMLNFGTQMFTFDMVASDADHAILSTIFQFGFQIFLRNKFGQMGPYAEIINTDDDIEYSGTDVVSRTIVNFPQFVDLSQYFSETDLDQATQLEIRPVMNRTSGADNGAFFDTDVVWYVNINQYEN